MYITRIILLTQLQHSFVCQKSICTSICYVHNKDWLKKRYVYDIIMYITAHVHDIIMYIPTNRFFLLSCFVGPHVKWSHTGMFMSFLCTYQHMFISWLCIYQQSLFCIPFQPHVKWSHLGVFMSLLCICDTCLCHCYGYSNICFLDTFMASWLNYRK